MILQCRPLIEVLCEIPDFRKSRGKRHSLPFVLALICVGMLCGCRSYSAIAQWARIYPRELLVGIGLKHSTPPCAATLSIILRQLDRQEVERRLGRWAQSALEALAPDEAWPGEAVAIDGKTLRGSRGQGADNTHLLSALSHRLGLTLGQESVENKTNEITQALPLLSGLVLKGRIFTMDALLTQRSVAKKIVDEGGHYLMIAKANQPRLEEEVSLVFTEPPDDDRKSQAETIDRAHGRTEHRRLTASQALVGYSDWLGLQQVFKLERQTLITSTGNLRRQVVYGLTSLEPDQADARRLLEIARHHWLIENRSHCRVLLTKRWVRDSTFNEDQSQVRLGSTPQVMAAFRNTAIGLLRLAGESNIAAACRRLAAQPRSAITLIGIRQDN